MRWGRVQIVDRSQFEEEEDGSGRAECHQSESDIDEYTVTDSDEVIFTCIFDFINYLLTFQDVSQKNISTTRFYK